MKTIELSTREAKTFFFKSKRRIKKYMLPIIISKYGKDTVLKINKFRLLRNLKFALDMNGKMLLLRKHNLAIMMLSQNFDDFKSTKINTLSLGVKPILSIQLKSDLK